MTEKKEPGIYLKTDTGVEVEIVLIDTAGVEGHLSNRTPAAELTAYVNRDYTEYKRAVEELWEKHPVFEECDQVLQEDYEDFQRQAISLAKELSERDQVAWLEVMRLIGQALELTDDGDPIFFARKAHVILEALRLPYRVQNRMRNIFEIAFADFERGTQQERFDALESVWPGIVDRYFPVRLLPESGGQSPVGRKMEYHPSGLYAFYLVLLSFYFRQSKKRIARCENCWRYFVPKSSAKTLYCDTETNGVSCKASGSKHMRRLDADRDEAIAAYNRLRHTLAERANRFETAAPWERKRLKPFDRSQYDAWLIAAQEKREQYEAGKLSGEMFLRGIDLCQDLWSYDAHRTTLPNLNRTPWRKAIRQNIDFNPEEAFVDMDFLDLGQEAPEWEIITGREQSLHARGGHQSLQDRYERPIDLAAHAEILDTVFSGDKEDDEGVLTLRRAVQEYLREKEPPAQEE